MSLVVVAKGKDIIKRTVLALTKLSPTLPEKGSRILIKPNLVEAMPNDSGAITRKETVEGIIKFLSDRDYEILVGEGAGIHNTFECFEKAGYYELEGKYKIKLVDLNKGKFTKLKGEFWEFEVNSLCLESYLISVAVLKEHAFEVTLTLKNLMGVLKPWEKLPTKEYIHKENDMRIWALRLCDLVKKVKPQLNLIDATTGMFGSHLYGRLKRFDLTITSEDPVACDFVGAEILGHKNVYHINLALEKGLGFKPSKIEKVILEE